MKSFAQLVRGSGTVPAVVIEPSRIAYWMRPSSVMPIHIGICGAVCLPSASTRVCPCQVVYGVAMLSPRGPSRRKRRPSRSAKTALFGNAPASG